LATRNDRGTVSLWETATGNRLTAFYRQSRDLAFVAGGDILATSDLHSLGADQATRVRLWDVRTGRERATVPIARPTGRILVSPDGRLIAIGGAGVRLCDAATGQENVWLGKGTPSTAAPLAFSADGRVLVWTQFVEPMRVWDVTARREIVRLKTDDNMAALSPDGRTLSTCESLFSAPWRGRASGAIRLWDLPSGREKASLVGHKSPIIGMLFSPDGKTLVSYEKDEAIARDVSNGRELDRTLGDFKVIVRDLATGNCLNRLPPEGGDRDFERYCWTTAYVYLRLLDFDFFFGRNIPGLLDNFMVFVAAPRFARHVIAATFVQGPKGSFAAVERPGRRIEIWAMSPPPDKPK
jgi:WD40 repeat protein